MEEIKSELAEEQPVKIRKKRTISKYSKSVESAFHTLYEAKVEPTEAASYLEALYYPTVVVTKSDE